MTDIDISILLAPAGIAFIIGIFIQLYLKPKLKERYKDESHEKYSATLNGITLLLSVALGVLGTVGINWGSLTAATIITGGLVGLVGGAMAIGGAESLGNFQKARK